MNRREALLLLCSFTLFAVGAGKGVAQLTENEDHPLVGDAPADPGPLARNLSSKMHPADIKAVMRKVVNWQTARIVDHPSQDWTFATLYIGMLHASATLHNQIYEQEVQRVAQHYDWSLGPRRGHADDQAIGQSYLWLSQHRKNLTYVQHLQAQFDELMQTTDDPAKPVWWWCDALFMAPPVWAGLSTQTHDRRYLQYMDHEWKITSASLWDPKENLFSRDRTYLQKREKNGRKVFWSRGNGWVMGGLAGVLDELRPGDPLRAFYVQKFVRMAEAVVRLQGKDGLWRPGLLDEQEYPLPEVSGSAFFIYAISWGLNHHILDAKTYRAVVERGWAGLVAHIYEDGRLGCIQPVGEAPSNYSSSASSVFGVGAFLLAGSEVHKFARITGRINASSKGLHAGTRRDGVAGKRAAEPVPTRSSYSEAIDSHQRHRLL